MRVIGLDKVKSEMDRIVAKAETYRKSGAKIPDFVINLPQKNGQSYTADYIATVLYDNNLRRFCGLDIVLEYRPDGSLKSIKKMFEDISASAVYTNEYEGVVAVDISKLSEYINEFQVDYFVEKISEVSESATVIIFYDKEIGKRVEVVKNRVCSVLSNCVEIDVEPYSEMELSEIAVENIRERGIDIDIQTENELISVVCNVVKIKNVINAKEAVKMADELSLCVDYSDSNPKIEMNRVIEFYYQTDNGNLGRALA